MDRREKIALSQAIVDRITEESGKAGDENARINFAGVVVPSNLDLPNLNNLSVSFRSAQFYSGANFRKSKFNEDASFHAARFHLEADFTDTTFRGPCKFQSSEFHRGARFSGATFAKDANFSKALFIGVAIFNGEDGAGRTRFKGEARFTHAEFRGKALFGSAHFYKSALFEGSADPVEPEKRYFHEVSFRKAQFDGIANFSTRDFLTESDFGGCTFNRAPNFHGASLHQNTTFGGIEYFPDVRSNGAVLAYQTLRQAMESHRARHEEGMFYALEQKARRSEMKILDFGYWVSRGYELGSNYGLSVIYPLLWAVGIFEISTVSLAGIGIVESGCRDFGCYQAMLRDALLFSVRQTFVLFEAIRANEEILTGYAFNLGDGGWLRAWGTVLTLLEATAALLLVLAVRWRFKR